MSIYHLPHILRFYRIGMLPALWKHKGSGLILLVAFYPIAIIGLRKLYCPQEESPA